MSDKLRQALGYPDRYRAIREHAKTSKTCVLRLTYVSNMEEGTIFQIAPRSSLGYIDSFSTNKLKVVRIIDDERVLVTNV